MTGAVTHMVDQQEFRIQLLERELHPLCRDTPNKTAWVAYREGETRCFLEQDDFPHRAHGSSI